MHDVIRELCFEFVAFIALIKKLWKENWGSRGEKWISNKKNNILSFNDHRQDKEVCLHGNLKEQESVRKYLGSTMTDGDLEAEVPEMKK